MEGPVFGAADRWNGVGIFFDSFDNDGKVGWKQTLLGKMKLISCLVWHLQLWGKKRACHFPISPHLLLKGLH